jgi:hypothetical protein
MTEVVLASCSGGIVNLTLIEDLRGDTVTGDAKELADLALFEDKESVRPTRAQYDADFEAAFATGRSLWSAHADEIEQGMDAGRLRERLLGPFLSLLGFNLQFQRSHLSAGDGSFRITHMGWEGEDAPPMILDPAPPDVRGERQRRSAHEEMQAYLNASTKHTWGIVSDGRVVRLVRDFHHTRTKGYVEFEVEHIFEASSVADFRAFFRACHSSRFTARPELHGGDASVDQSPHDSSLLELLHHRSVSAGVAAGRRLQPQVRRAIEHLANGAIATNPELRRRVLEEAGFGRELYRELLTVLYRVLFLLFAEQREMLRGNRLYEETYSLARLRKTAETNRTEGRRFDLWEGLKATFTAFHDDKRASALGVYPYNGELFDPSRIPNIGSAHIPNSEVVIAIRSLTTVEVNKMTLYVDYRNLGVEELGTVYESLLDYRLRINDTGGSLAVTDATSERIVASGHAYLAPMSTERGDLASYYTPPALVSLVLDRNLDLLLEERLAAAGSNTEARVAAILDLRVIDPACGSGAFLAEALERLAVALAREQAAPSEPADAELATARREILSRCIYGADKDPFAVELCKVALWIHCAVPDAPLSFLDHHIVCGDSLVGWPMFDVPDAIPDAAFDYTRADKEDKKILLSARRENKAFLAGMQTLWAAPVLVHGELSLPSLLQRPDRTHDDVREKTRAYSEYLASDSYRNGEAAANLWTSAFFWTHLHGPAPTTREYRSFLAGRPDDTLAEEATAICEPVNPLHWALAFPDIRDRGGFDLVIGNPPWEQFKGEELEFFADSAPALVPLPSKERKLAIDAMAENDPVLYQKWRDYQSGQSRLAHYAKNADCRFTRTSGEANTYLLFAELAFALLRPNGRAGLVLKTGLAVDAAQSAVWNKLLDQGAVEEVLDFLNGNVAGSQQFFTSVSKDERFCVVALGKRERETKTMMVSMMGTSIEDSIQRLRLVSYADLAASTPVTRTLISCRTGWELDLMTEIHRRWKVLPLTKVVGSTETPDWNVRYVTVYHSSGGQKYFISDQALSEGWRLEEDGSLSRSSERALPVFEGKMVNRYDHRSRTYRGYSGTNKYGRRPEIPRLTPEQHADPSFEPEPRYWVRSSIGQEHLNSLIGESAVVSIRDVGRAVTEPRLVKATLLRRVPATDKLPFLVAPLEQALKLVALLNSSVFDFQARLIQGGSGLKSWILGQCAVPPPKVIDSSVRDLVVKLSVTSTALADEYELPLHAWDAESRFGIEAEIDARVARSFGLSLDQYTHMWDHFDVHRSQEVRHLGEFRSKRRAIEAYEQLEEGS